MTRRGLSGRGGSCGDGEGCSRAAGGGLPPEERRDRAADPACAHASRAGAIPGPDGLGGMPGVRGCVACRRRPGPSKSRRNITAGRHPSPQGLRPDGPRTAEVAETYMARRGFCTESHDPPGSAVGKDSDEALHRTIQIMPFAGEFEPCNGSIRRGSARADHHVLLQFHAFAYLCPVSVSWDLAALISQRPPIASQDGQQSVKRASSVRCINQR